MLRILFPAKIFLFFLGLVVATIGIAQTPLNEVLTADPAVRIGKLGNGLTYYIRQNKKPEQKVELRLALNAGSIVEDDDQLGLAHMAEHMAFNGTKNFKKNDIVSFLQDIGVGFGSDLNAYTSFDETVYILPIPTDKPGNIEKGFQVLEDWAHQVTYLDEDIESERPIILEESRLGKGAQDRMYKQIYPKLFAGSKYAKRITIGSDSIIKTFKPELIRKFYRDWYRPDLMAVVVVGDIDPDAALALIKKHFEAISNPVNERKREFVTVPTYAKSEALVVTDKEATNYSININYPVKPEAPDKTVGDYRATLVKQLFTSLLNQRLQELTQQSNPPFVGAAAGVGNFIRGHENFRAFAAVGTGDIKRGLDALFEEIERAKRFGFTAAELERAKKSTLSSMERLYNNRDKTESELYVGEYVRNFLSEEAIPGIAREYALYKEQVPGITLEEVNAIARQLTADTNRLVYVTGPENNTTTKVPAPADLLAIISAKEKADIKPYEEKAVATELLKVKPVAGKVTSRTENKAMGVTEIKLSNGVTVTLKSTEFKNDQVLMGATRGGGKNYYGIADHYNAEYAVPIVSAMGVGEFSPTDLRKALAGKSVAVNPQVSDISDGFRGNSSKKDIETMFQLIHLYVTQPRKDTTLFRSFVQRNKSQVAALSSNPQNAFIDTMFKVMYNNNPLAPVSVPKAAYFDQVNLDRAMAIYKERIGDASGMHFVFVGSLNIDSMVPLLETYLGSLPSSGKVFKPRDNGVRPVKGNRKLVVNKGREQKSLILSFYTGEQPYSDDLSLKAQAISEILNIRIIEELREKIQGIYGGGLYASVEKYPYNNYSFVLQLPCGPEKVDTLLKAARHEINQLIANGPGQSYLDKVKKQWLEEYKTSIKENETWLSELLEQRSIHSDPKYFLQYEQMVQKLTVKDIQLTARKLFDGKNVYTAVLLPETVETKSQPNKAF
ncbi:M16 family metallopeptidase [Flavihumibacter profundi]|uniref:M16 family metallopeptidase n=1 Tax=Flavihumibacter profundi TaxID=2716883 RepID=UPI001CC808B6|nr:insulinase family protein [Flavihumibacter profundi]MBZ5857160.1 insulinase family protein [Flavihumibacter profundi]